MLKTKTDFSVEEKTAFVLLLAFGFLVMGSSFYWLYEEEYSMLVMSLLTSIVSLISFILVKKGHKTIGYHLIVWSLAVIYLVLRPLYIHLFLSSLDAYIRTYLLQTTIIANILTAGLLLNTKTTISLTILSFLSQVIWLGLNSNEYLIKYGGIVTLIIGYVVTTVVVVIYKKEKIKNEEILKEKMKIAEDSNTTKSYFLANVSHEIRTPMNGVLGMTEVMLQTDLSPEQKEYMEIIKDSGKSLLFIINDILDYSKMEAGKMKIGNDLFCFMDLFKKYSLLAFHGEKKEVEFVSIIDPKIPEIVVGDELRIKQILDNLISNATKFTDKGEIKLEVFLLSLDETNATLKFNISDTGIGIAEEDVKRLFNKFSQLDSSYTKKYRGTGLGLSICKELVELMGGEIGVKSKVGFGSTFWFTIKVGLFPQG